MAHSDHSKYCLMTYSPSLPNFPAEQDLAAELALQELASRQLRSHWEVLGSGLKRSRYFPKQVSNSGTPGP